MIVGMLTPFLMPKTKSIAARLPHRFSRHAGGARRFCSCKADICTLLFVNNY